MLTANAQVTQSTRNADHLAEEISSLSDFPVVSMQANEMDNALPALAWQADAAQRVAARFGYGRRLVFFSGMVSQSII
jgi:hypothetical protein